MAFSRGNYMYEPTYYARPRHASGSRMESHKRVSEKGTLEQVKRKGKGSKGEKAVF